MVNIDLKCPLCLAISKIKIEPKIIFSKMNMECHKCHQNVTLLDNYNLHNLNTLMGEYESNY